MEHKINLGITNYLSKRHRDSVHIFFQSLLRHRGAIGNIALKNMSITSGKIDPSYGEVTIDFMDIVEKDSVPAEKDKLEEYRDVDKQYLNEHGINPFAVDLLIESPLMQAVPIICFRTKHKDKFYKIRIEREEQ